MGPGTTETQLGSHSAMRLGSEMRSKTSWMETPTVPVYVRETGRMGANMAAKGGRDAKGGRGAARWCVCPTVLCRPLPPVAALRLIAALSVGARRLDLRGCRS